MILNIIFLNLLMLKFKGDLTLSVASRRTIEDGSDKSSESSSRASDSTSDGLSDGIDAPDFSSLSCDTEHDSAAEYQNADDDPLTVQTAVFGMSDWEDAMQGSGIGSSTLLIKYNKYFNPRQYRSDTWTDSTWLQAGW